MLASALLFSTVAIGMLIGMFFLIAFDDDIDAPAAQIAAQLVLETERKAA